MSSDFDAILSQGWRPLWELSGSSKRPRFSCFLRPWPPNGPPENITSFWEFSLHRYDEHGLVYRPGAPAEIFKKIEGLVAGMRSNDRGFKKTGTAIHSVSVRPLQVDPRGGRRQVFQALQRGRAGPRSGLPGGGVQAPGEPPQGQARRGVRALPPLRQRVGPAGGSPRPKSSVEPHPHILKNQALVTNFDVPEFKSVEATLNFLQPEDQPSSPKGGGRAADDLDQLGGPRPVAPGLLPSPGSTSSAWDRALGLPL